jgi:hypothetical protein
MLDNHMPDNPENAGARFRAAISSEIGHTADRRVRHVLRLRGGQAL